MIWRKHRYSVHPSLQNKMDGFYQLLMELAFREEERKQDFIPDS